MVHNPFACSPFKFAPFSLIRYYLKILRSTMYATLSAEECGKRAGWNAKKTVLPEQAGSIEGRGREQGFAMR